MIYRWSARDNVVEKVFDLQKFSSYRFLIREGKIYFHQQDDFERLVINLEGVLTIYLPSSDREIILNPKDVCYIPPYNNDFEAKSENCFAVVFQGMSRSKSNVQIIRFGELRADLRGTVGCRRFVYTCIGEKDFGWMLIGFTEGFRGEWTSYPSHRHNDKLEAYVYYGPSEHLGLQLIEDEEKVEAYVVRPRDVVLIKRGYHPNVPAPGCEMKYLWVLYPLGERSMKIELKPGNSTLL